MAMKARDSRLVGALRYILAQIKNQQIAMRAELTDSEVEKVLRREAKRRHESIAAYKKAGRQKLMDQEAMELTVIEKYLPQMMSRKELEKLVNQVVEEVEIDSEIKFGRVMAVVMQRGRGRVDGKLATEMVKAKLS